MQASKFISLSIAVVLFVCGASLAKTKKYGVDDVRKITLTARTRVGEVLLPKGDYEVRHTMEAENHIMVFRQLGGKLAEARVKCNLVQLKQKADRDQVVYTLNSANERVLQTLRFGGDTAEHRF